MQKLVFIHGANCSPVIWNYLAPKIKGKKEFVAYDTAIPFEKNMETIKQDLSKFKDAIIIAHSMGGLYAAHILKSYGQHNVKAVISISTPFAGSERAAQMAVWFPDYQMLKDIATNSRPVVDSQKVLNDIHIPWLQLVSVKGHVPLVDLANDGVVSIQSQKHIQNIKYIELPYNHFEILLNDDTVTTISEFIAGLD